MNDEQFVKVGRALAELLDLLERPSPFTPTCTCGWRGQDWDDEADAQAEAWAHMPCQQPHYGTCTCGWRGEERAEIETAQAELDAHLATHD